jgi:hypothetical protein
MATSSSWKKRVEKGIPEGNYNDFQHSEKVDLSIKTSGNGKRATGWRSGMNDDDDAMTDEGADDDDDI